MFTTRSLSLLLFSNLGISGSMLRWPCRVIRSVSIEHWCKIIVPNYNTAHSSIFERVFFYVDCEHEFFFWIRGHCITLMYFENFEAARRGVTITCKRQFSHVSKRKRICSIIFTADGKSSYMNTFWDITSSRLTSHHRFIWASTAYTNLLTQQKHKARDCHLLSKVMMMPFFTRCSQSGFCNWGPTSHTCN